MATCHEAPVGGAPALCAALGEMFEKARDVRDGRLTSDVHSAIATVAARTQREWRFFMVCLLSSKNRLFSQCGSLRTLFFQGPPLLQGLWHKYQINGAAQHRLFELRVFLETLYFSEMGDSALPVNPALQTRLSAFFKLPVRHPKPLDILATAAWTASACMPMVFSLRNWRPAHHLFPALTAGGAARRPAPAPVRKPAQTPAGHQRCRLQQSGPPAPGLPSNSGQRRPAPA